MTHLKLVLFDESDCTRDLSTQEEGDVSPFYSSGLLGGATTLVTAGIAPNSVAYSVAIF